MVASMSNDMPPPPPSSNRIREPKSLLLGATVLGLIGSFGPWATVSTFLGDISVDGSDSDGQLTMIMFAIVGILAVAGKSRGTTIASLVVAALIAVIAVIDIYDVNDVTGDFGGEMDELFSASVGWGLWVVLFAAVVALVAGAMRLKSGRHSG